jgi:hypothetical protein
MTSIVDASVVGNGFIRFRAHATDSGGSLGGNIKIVTRLSN